MRQSAIGTVSGILLAALAAGSGHAQALGAHDLSDAYAYLLGRALVIRQEQTDLKEPGIAHNVIQYNPVGSADFVNPNLDVAYLEAWIAVSDEAPVLLEVPKTRGATTPRRSSTSGAR